MNRFEKAAKKISQHHGVHVYWAPANREYVVEYTPAYSAREADKLARAAARRANAHGVLGGM